jgi:hypothetical protein
MLYSKCIHFSYLQRVSITGHRDIFVPSCISETVIEISLRDKDFWNLHAMFNINTLLKPQMLSHDPYGPEGVNEERHNKTVVT